MEVRLCDIHIFDRIQGLLAQPPIHVVAVVLQVVIFRNHIVTDVALRRACLFLIISSGLSLPIATALTYTPEAIRSIIRDGAGWVHLSIL